MTVYVMKAQLKGLWNAGSARQWRSQWRQWLAHARQSKIPALQKFARALKPYWRGIVSRVRWPTHTGQLVGINHRIKVIKRSACDCCDTGYLLPKIKAALPGRSR